MKIHTYLLLLSATIIPQSFAGPVTAIITGPTEITAKKNIVVDLKQSDSEEEPETEQPSDELEAHEVQYSVSFKRTSDKTDLPFETTTTYLWASDYLSLKFTTAMSCTAWSEAIDISHKHAYISCSGNYRGYPYGPSPDSDDDSGSLDIIINKHEI